MANRSYLYSFNQDKKGKISKIFDISEQNCEIPIIYKILVSENTEIVPSIIFEDSLALKGNAQAGRKKLIAFFRKIQKTVKKTGKWISYKQDGTVEKNKEY